MSHIDPTAEIHPSARLGPGVVIGAHAVIGAECRLDAYAIVGPYTTLGRGCHVFSFAVIGAAPQDRRSAPDGPGRLVCGASNTFREGVTVSRGTAHGGGLTTLGAGNLLMAHSHVGHDSRLGDEITLANGVSLAGHVEIGHRVSFGGHAAVHQFARVGELAFVAANAMVSRDVPPYCMAAGDRATLRGLNRIGLERAGLSPETRRALRATYRQIFRVGPRRAAAEAALGAPEPAVAQLARFVLESARGVCATARRGASDQPSDTG